MILRQFFDTSGASLSYLLADPVTRDAALIDPVAAQQAAYRQCLRRMGLRLRYLMMTHVHALKGAVSSSLVEESGARLLIHGQADAACCDQRLRDGDRIYVGESFIEVLHIPGHTSCSVAFHCEDRLFTGDSLWIGRTEHESEPHIDAVSRNGYVRQRLFGLADETLVYPGHDWDSRRVSCIVQERMTNRERHARLFSGNAMEMNAGPSPV